MSFIYCPNGFNLNKNLVFDNQISQVIPDNHALIANLEGDLLGYSQVFGAQFYGERVLIDFLKETSSKRIANLVCATYDRFC